LTAKPAIDEFANCFTASALPCQHLGDKDRALFNPSDQAAVFPQASADPEMLKRLAMSRRS
ncbi:MAG TPA: hypothetical protein VKE70_34120, partial [Candidatus Solibacter sp.]|nr:hypothetical protein [Candidatus Solibacter sp.]